MAGIGWENAAWNAPPNVRAGTTYRDGGVSRPPFASFNLAQHVGDDDAAVLENRARLRAGLKLPAEPLWLDQVHGRAVAVHSGGTGRPQADGAVAFEDGRVLAVLTADCLPLVLASRDGTRIGIAHAGWRGLAAGIIENTVGALGVSGDEILAWLGPAIGPAAFEVGGEVREAFVSADPGATAAFVPNARGRWQADLGALARRRLESLGVREVSGGGACTWSDPARYFSYRRAPATGRLATLVWRESGTA